MAADDPLARLHIGTSGWNYDHWKGRFYPEGMPSTQCFDHYAQHFQTVEINNSFYQLPKPKTVDAWREQAPPGFRYSVKYSRYGSHMKRLKDPADHLATFLEPVERLKSFLGPILVQLPPNWGCDPDRLAEFLRAAPRRRDWAIEIRDPDWLDERVYELLREAGAALVVHDMLDGDHPRLTTTDWTYLRWHGDHYRGRYGARALVSWADWIADRLADGTRVWGYFNNDENAYAVEDARTLIGMVAERLGVSTGD